MREKRILTVGPSFDSLGGISTVSKMLNDYMNKEGHPVDHLGSMFEGSFFKKQLFTLFSYVKFLKILASRRYCLIHIHSSTDYSFYRKIYFIVLSKLAKKRIILQVHPGRFYDFFKSKKRFLQYFIKKILGMPDVIIVLSEGIKEKLITILPEGKISVLPNPVNCAHFRCQKQKKEKVILYLGWFVKEKGVYDIVKAIPDVIAKDPTVKFVFCGAKEKQNLRSLFENVPFKNQVSVNEWVMGEEKTDILAQSTMLLLPSYTEGFPNVILEAMASCLPIVTTPVGAIPEVLQEGRNCLYVQPGDAEALAEKILHLLKHPELGMRMGDENLHLVRETYDIKIVGSKLEGIYSRYMNKSA